MSPPPLPAGDCSGEMRGFINGNSSNYSANSFRSSSLLLRYIVPCFFVSVMNGLSRFILKSSARQIYVNSLYL